MKKAILKVGVLAIAALTMMSFGIVHTIKKNVDVTSSKIEWVGKKVTGQHSGTINLKSGDVVLDHGRVVGGSFVIDMTTINVTDLTGEYKGKLEGHLNSDDFFGVENHKEATFVISSVIDGTVSGDLTIKGHTEKVSFALTTGANSIKGAIKVDRTKFGIKYGSNSFFDNLKDKAIDNEFELNLNIVF